MTTRTNLSLRNGARLTSGNIVAAGGITPNSAMSIAPTATIAAGTTAGGACASGPSPLQRLTNRQYINAAVRLLNLPANIGSSLVLSTDQKGAGPFAANSSQPLAANDIYQYMAAAEQLSSAAADAKFVGILPCTYDALDAACVSQFITQFGGNAWRRPLTASDNAVFATATSAAIAANDFSGAIKIVMGALRVSGGRPRPHGLLGSTAA